MARTAASCEDRLIVSEVNWPLKGTGVYSPVGSPYESPGPRCNDPSVSEDEYADYLLRYLLLALCSGMVEQVCWWFQNRDRRGLSRLWEYHGTYRHFGDLDLLTSTRAVLAKYARF